jgi:hypothetical protein
MDDHEALLTEAFASGDAGFVSHALEIVARARGVQVTLTRDSLPELLRVMRRLGLTLTVHLDSAGPPAS